ncbi:50S ribosomal protein L9 [Solicola gregarius]|uniref:Large ribosomal subunit protein bL9 n=1 Tax=Solicola gregarius TaxID=2908642 RepID=A0AA46YNC0_9ACTN|nr:50S ribosomal protein L9 [Solicola gregarius]UYM07331.1 50S ribosomal protein L9 [Solicola gregarius]
MKLILTHEVANLGAPGDVVEVKDGYGRNFLMPRGYALRWTRGAEKQIDSIKKARTVREVRDVAHAEEIRAQIEGVTLKLRERVGEGGRLFGSVTVSEIAAALKDQTGIDVDKRRIEVGNAIKSIGGHTVTVSIHDEVSAKLALDVAAAS